MKRNLEEVNLEATIQMYVAQRPYTTREMRVIVFGGLLQGMIAAWEDDEKAWARAFELARRLGVEIKAAYNYSGPLTESGEAAPRKAKMKRIG